MDPVEEVALALEAVTGALPGGGEVRLGQASMAAAVAEAIGADEHLVVQAGTGTGKTLAYLVPAILSGRRTVVATWSKALQDQMVRSDLPLLAAHLGRPFTFAVLKGWDNYACLERIDQVRSSGIQQTLEGEGEDGGGGDCEGADGAGLERILAWAGTTPSGDRADLPFEPDQATWSAVSVGTDECLGVDGCPFGEGCFPAAARQRARLADLCVTNHHLYAVDVALDGMLLDLPDHPHEVVVSDEAHQLEDVFTAAFGFQLTRGRFDWLARLARSAGLTGGQVLEGLAGAGNVLAAGLSDHEDQRIVPGPDSDLEPLLLLAESRVDAVLTAGRSAARAAGGDAGHSDGHRARRLQRLAMAGGTLLGDIRLCREVVGNPDKREHVVWVERSGRTLALLVAPIEVGQRLATGLWPRRTTVLASATVPTNLPERLAVPAPTVAVVDSPFDYEGRALLYCPSHIPNPTDDEQAWSAAAVEEIRLLVLAGGGRTLALFTSWRRLREAARRIRGEVPFPVLEQGDLPAGALLESFAGDEQACLFATRSFWQGIDVPGPSLGLVVIDRIPFPRPDEHLVRAWRDRAGPDGWGAVDLPLGALRLAQGAGRLIRSQQDQGVVAVLDPRLSGARYSAHLLAALPPMRRTADREEALAFLRGTFG